MKRIESKSRSPGIKTYRLIFFGIWTCCIAASFTWNIVYQKKAILSLARARADLTLKKDMIYRKWLSSKGGVYVPVSTTAPNPYLKVPDREITTVKGHYLTLMNPAYMTRQVNEMAKEAGFVLGHITSLRPIRPENFPDEWEKKALHAFEKGTQEVYGKDSISGEEYFRMMRPFIVDSSCLKCHAAQGYRVGEIRGGISSSISMQPLRAVEREMQVRIALAHGVIWILGIFGIAIGSNRVSTQIERTRSSERIAKKERDKAESYLNIAAEIIIALDADGKITLLNDSGHRLLGHKSGTLIGKNWFDTCLPEKEKEDTVAYLEKLKLGDTDEMTREGPAITKDGTERQILWRNTVLRDDAGGFIGTLSSGQDITNRKRAEEAVSAVMNLNEFAAVHSIDEMLQNTLDRAEALTGSQIGFLHFLEPDQKTLHLQMWSTNTLASMCTAKGKGAHYNIDQAGVWVDCVHERRPVIHNDYAKLPHRKGLPRGHAPIIRELVVPVMRKNQIMAILGVGNKSADYDLSDVEILSMLADKAWDIIVHKQAEEALRESEKRYAMILGAVNDGFWDWAIPTGDAFFSPIYYAILGYDDREFPASYATWRPLVHPDDIDRVERDLLQSIETGSSFAIDCRMKMKSGVWRWVSTRGRTVEWDNEKRARRMIGTLTDITGRKRAEEDIQMLLSEKELLLKEVHHRIKNNMAMIAGLLALQASQLSEPGGVQALKESSNRVNSMTTMYDLLYQTRDFRYVNVRDYIGQIISGITKSLPAIAGVTVERQVEDFVMDSRILFPIGIIINELVTNAYKYAFPDGRTGAITISMSQLPEHHVEISVRDNGIGIPESLDINGQSGFGMKLVNLLVKQIDGTLECVRGAGTEFRVNIHYGDSSPGYQKG